MAHFSKKIIAGLLLVGAAGVCHADTSIRESVFKASASRDFLTAYTVLTQNPKEFSLEEKSKVKGDYAILLYRSALADMLDPLSKNFLEEAQTIEESILKEYKEAGKSAVDQKRFVADLITIYADNVQYEKAIELYETYEGKDQLPSYSLLQVYKSYSKLREYQTAINLLNEIKSKDPLNFNINKERVLLLCDMQLYSSALHAISLMRDAHIGSSKEQDFLEILVYLYSNDFAKAQTLINVQLAKDPKNLDVRLAQADLYAWSGNPQKESQELLWIKSEYPDFRYVQEKLLTGQIRRGQLPPELTENLVVAEETKEVLKNAAKSTIGMGASKDRQSGPTYENYETKYNFWGKSYLFDGIVAFDLTTNDATSTNATFLSKSLGYTYYLSPKWSMTGGITAQKYSKNGFFIENEYGVSDAFHVLVKAEKNSTDAPIKATKVGTTVDKISTKVYGNSPTGFSYTASLSYASFSDNNQRTDQSVVLRTNTITLDRHNFNFGGAVYLTQNSYPASFNGAYFNPSSIGSFELFGSYGISAFKVGTHAIQHKIEFSWGTTKQAQFKALPTYSLSYSAGLKQSEDLELSMRIGIAQRPYDGVAENILSMGTNLSYKF